MRTVVFKEMLRQVGREWLGDPDDVTYSAVQKERMAGALSRGVMTGYEHAEWPEFIRVELRPFRPAWSTSEQYPIGTEIYDTVADAYYESLTVNTGKRPSENSSDWTLVECLDHYLPWSMPGYWPFSQVLGVYADDPGPENAKSYTINHDWRGAWVRACQQNQVWVQYMMLPPTFTAEEFSATETYALGDIRYFPDENGECCQALLDNDGSEVWSPLPFPYFLSIYAVYYACALLNDDPAKSAKFRAMAEEELERTYVVNKLRPANNPQRVQVTL